MAELDPPSSPTEPAPTPVPVKRQRIRRTWPQRLVLGVNAVVVVALVATSIGLLYANHKLGERKVVTLEKPPTSEVATSPASAASTGDTVDEGPVPDVAAANFLVTGSDNGDCQNTDGPAANIGDRSQFGERSDTIMVIRLDPAANQAAVLSFPRDLWVDIAGSNRKSRINSAFDREDPNRLAQTITENFGIPIDHYIGIDFCAFKEIVDAVGGVRVPFPYAVRDRGTGLQIPAAGCYLLGPDEALDYVRSRKYEYLDPTSGDWKDDPTSDFGRISRQQDFIRRAVQKALDKGARDPRIANQLVNAGLDYVISSFTTVGEMLDFASAMRNLDPATIRTYTIESTPQTISSNAVLVPRLNTDNMQTILSVFKGEARLADAPDQVFAPTTTAAPITAPSGSSTSGAGSTTAAPTTEPGTTLPVVDAVQKIQGIVPPADLSCR